MTLPGGAGSQLGIKEQSVYETAVAVDRFALIQSSGIKRTTAPFMDRAVGGGAGMMQREDDFEQITTGAGGDVVITVRRKGLGKWLKAALGQVATTRIGTPPAVTITTTTVGDGSHNEVQHIAISETPTGGTFPLTFSGQTAAAVAYNASNAAVVAALEALSNIGVGDVAVTGGPLPNTGIDVTFQGALALTNVAQMTSGTNALTNSSEYRHRFTPDIVNGEIGSFYTVQGGLAMSDGTVIPVTWDGGKVVSWSLKCDNSGALVLTLTWVFHYETFDDDDGGAYLLQSASFPLANYPFNYSLGTIELNGVSRVMKSFEVKGDKGYDVARTGVGAALRREPVPNGEYAITGSMDAEWEEADDYLAFINGTTMPLVITFASLDNIPDEPNPFQVVIDVPVTRLLGETPAINGMDLLRVPISFKGFWDGTNPICTVDYHTSDVTP